MRLKEGQRKVSLGALGYLGSNLVYSSPGSRQESGGEIPILPFS